MEISDQSGDACADPRTRPDPRSGDRAFRPSAERRGADDIHPVQKLGDGANARDPLVDGR